MADCPACGHANRDEAKFCDDCGTVLQLACPQCATPLRPAAKFCDECGHRVASAAAAVSAPAAPTTSAPAVLASAEPATIAAGRYEIRDFLGEGGRKRVYLARDTRLDRDVALALIKTDDLDEGGRLRIRREAQAMGRLGDHPHVVTVFDVGEENGRLYIVSQHMPGGDLEQQLRAADDHRLPVADAVRIGTEIAAALEHAHARQVIHRDVKPGNVWLAEDGTALLGDFGLAVALDQSRITQEGLIVGTATYLPPEQAVGGGVDARSDLYALGCVLYEMVAGRPPFAGDDAVSIISQHLNATPVAPTWHNSAVPMPLEALILELLAKAPADRPPSATAVRERLGAIAALPRPGSDQISRIQAPTGAGAVRQAWGRFVGRAREMEQLRAGIDAAIGGRGGVMMVVGEPGIGKTRTADEAGTYAKMRGAQVLVGRCYEGEGAPAFWPWVQILRNHVHAHEPEVLRSDMGSGAGPIAQIVSDVRDRLPDLADPPRLDPDQARFRLFDSVATFLRSASRREPLVVVLDDLHWADKPSLLLLQFVARELRGMRVLLLGTYRDVELDRKHPLSEALSELRRERLYERVLLRGFSVDEVFALLEAMAQHELEPDVRNLAAAIHRESEGNPFFCEEIVLHLIESGAIRRAADGRWRGLGAPEELGIPEGVREVIGRRLSKLSDTTNRVLALGAVVGREFDRPVLERASDLGGSWLLEALDEALAAGVIQPLPAGPDRFRFTHALIRETLYSELSTPERVRMHQAVGDAIEALHSDDLESRLAELAHHFAEGAAAGGDLEKGLDYARRAGDRAMAQVAYEDAVTHYDRALQVLALRQPPDPEARAALLLRLVDACWGAGEPDRAQAAARDAAEVGRRLGDGEILARAAIAFQEQTIEYGRPHEENVRLLRDALDLLPEKDSTLRARLLYRLSLWVRQEQDRAEEALALAGEALEIARRVNDPQTLSDGLGNWAAIQLGNAPTEELLPLISEAVDLDVQRGDLSREGYHRFLRLPFELELADLEAAEADMAVIRDLAERRLRNPRSRWSVAIWDSMRLSMAGRLDEAMLLAQEAYEIGSQVQEENARQYLMTAIGYQSAYQGVDDAQRELSLAFASQYADDVPIYELIRAQALLDLGHEAEADRAFARFMAEGPTVGARYLVALVSLAGATHFVWQRKARQYAAQLYELMKPHEDRVAVGGFCAGCFGALAPSLALMAVLLDQWDEAERLWAIGEDINRRIGHRAELIINTAYRAEAYLLRGGPGDRERALRYANEALAHARELDLHRIVTLAVDIKLRAQGVDPEDLSSSIHAVVASVQRGATDFGAYAGRDGSVTLMFSDVVDFTPMTERLGDAAAHALMQEHHAIVRDQVRRFGGRELELLGDGFLLAFASPAQALRCAVAIQQNFAARNATAAEPIDVRIGLHTGPAIRDADTFFGKTVILASRIANEAGGKQILASDEAIAACEAADEFRFDAGREYRLKGLADAYRLHAVAWSLEGGG